MLFRRFEGQNGEIGVRDWTILISNAWSAHFLPDANLRDTGLVCREAGGHANTGSWLPRRSLSMHALVFVEDGCGVYIDDANASGIRVNAPAVISLFPATAHEYGPVDPGWRVRWILFEGIATRAYEASALWTRAEPVQPATDQLASRLDEPFRRLRELAASPSRRSQALASTLTHQLLRIAAEETTTEARTESILEAVVAQAVEPGSLRERAGAIGIDPATLEREIRSASGLPPHEFVIRVRLARAQHLLAESLAPVRSIATQVGYDDPAYFSRIFRRRVGMSPSVFRQESLRRKI